MEHGDVIYHSNDQDNMCHGDSKWSVLSGGITKGIINEESQTCISNS